MGRDKRLCSGESVAMAQLPRWLKARKNFQDTHIFGRDCDDLVSLASDELQWSPRADLSKWAVNPDIPMQTRRNKALGISPDKTMFSNFEGGIRKQ